MSRNTVIDGKILYGIVVICRKFSIYHHCYALRKDSNRRKEYGNNRIFRAYDEKGFYVERIFVTYLPAFYEAPLNDIAKPAE
ncbi:hypothetical protein GMMP15_860009 [Candidatus Magnetomoraceae bacterium gMMP-15]